MFKIMNIGRNLYGRTNDWSWSSTYYHGISEHEKVTKRVARKGYFLFSSRPYTTPATKTPPFMRKDYILKGDNYYVRNGSFCCNFGG